MSFKRDGDDSASLHILQKRRVKDLMLEDIPADEAILMRDGRYSCKVCPHRPVFDTIIVLSQHRSGKKHAPFAIEFAAEKRELAALYQKRLQEGKLKSGKVASQGRDPNRLKRAGALSTTTPYNPRTQKRYKPHERRPTLALATDGYDATTENAPQTISQYRQQRRLDAVTCEPIAIRPYGAATTTFFEKGSGTGLRLDVKASCAERSRGRQTDTRKGDVYPRKTKSKMAALPMYGPTVNEEKRKQTELYLHQRGGGWKKDSDGKWTQDSDAEFDSDEEPPDLP